MYLKMPEPEPCGSALYTPCGVSGITKIYFPWSGVHTCLPPILTPLRINLHGCKLRKFASIFASNSRTEYVDIAQNLRVFLRGFDILTQLTQISRNIRAILRKYNAKCTQMSKNTQPDILICVPDATWCVPTNATEGLKSPSLRLRISKKGCTLFLVKKDRCSLFE